MGITENGGHRRRDSITLHGQSRDAYKRVQLATKNRKRNARKETPDCDRWWSCRRSLSSNAGSAMQRTCGHHSAGERRICIFRQLRNAVPHRRRNPGSQQVAGRDERTIPVDELRDRLNELDASKPTVVSCGVGLRGHVAQHILKQHVLKQHGFVSVANLSGGATVRRRAVQ